MNGHLINGVIGLKMKKGPYDLMLQKESTARKENGVLVLQERGLGKAVRK